MPVPDSGSVSFDALPGLTLREKVAKADVDSVRAIVTSTGFFNPGEIEIACELVTEALAKGPYEGYRFLFAELPDPRPHRTTRTIGYACYGETPCTTGTFDLYWIAVHNDLRTKGLGTFLQRETETRIRALGGRRLFAETSGRAQYEPTRRFYLKLGYKQEAVLADFYAPGDDKVIYGMTL